MNSILLVDDEHTISVHLQQTLQDFGYHVELAQTVEQALDLAKKTPFDLLLVDLNLRSERSEHPNEANGTGLVCQLRALGICIPILMFTVLEDEHNEMASLNAGADEYVLKTISIPRLLTRIQVNIRRHERIAGRKPTTDRWVGGGQLKLDREQRILAVGSKAIELTLRQGRIMDVLIANQTRVVTAEEILSVAWGHDIRQSPGVLENALYRLRERLREKGLPDLIENVRGKGYRLVVPQIAHTA